MTLTLAQNAVLVPVTGEACHEFLTALWFSPKGKYQPIRRDRVWQFVLGRPEPAKVNCFAQRLLLGKMNSSPLRKHRGKFVSILDVVRIFKYRGFLHVLKLLLKLAIALPEIHDTRYVVYQFRELDLGLL